MIWPSLEAHLAALKEFAPTEAHWRVIRFIREWHADHAAAPSARDGAAFMKARHAPQKYLYTLFPYGYVQQACYFAGIKQPHAWSTG